DVTRRGTCVPPARNVGRRRQTSRCTGALRRTTWCAVRGTGVPTARNTASDWRSAAPGGAVAGQPAAAGVTRAAVSVSESDRDLAVGAPGPAAGQSAHHASGDTIDLRALAPLAAWTRATQGDPAFRAICAAADVAPEGFSNGGGRVPVARLADWLSALRDRLGSDGALVSAGMAGETSPPAPPRWLRWDATPALLY